MTLILKFSFSYAHSLAQALSLYLLCFSVIKTKHVSWIENVPLSYLHKLKRKDAFFTEIFEVSNQLVSLLSLLQLLLAALNWKPHFLLKNNLVWKEKSFFQRQRRIEKNEKNIHKINYYIGFRFISRQFSFFSFMLSPLCFVCC